MSDVDFLNSGSSVDTRVKRDLEVERLLKTGMNSKNVAYNLKLSLVEVNTIKSMLNIQPAKATGLSLPPIARRAIEEHQASIHEREFAL